MDFSKEAFLDIIDRHQGIIYSLCAAWYPDVDDRNDARQDIILQLWKSFPSFREESTVSTWLYKVSLNTILNKIKKEKRMHANSSLDEVRNAIALHSFSADDDLQMLMQLIESLKHLDKALVILYLEGYKNKEIAEMLDITLTNVATRMNRIKTELRAKLKTGSYAIR